MILLVSVGGDKMIDPGISRGFGTVLTIGAGVIALDMMRHLEKPRQTYKSKPYHPTFRMKNTFPKQYGIKPMKWKL